MTHDELIEAVARAIWNCNFHPDDVASGEAERRISDWLEDWAKSVRHARAAIRVIAPAVLEEAAVWVQENYPFDKRTLVPAIRAMKTRYEV